MRLIIISNRLPVTIREQAGKLQFTSSAGGLATGVFAYLNSAKKAVSEYLWVGWPGGTFEPALQEEIRERCRADFHGYPVFLSAEDTERFYEGFCNNTIWPLFHYFPMRVDYDPGSWESYVRVNRIFRDAIAPIVQPDDLIWVHDYHFMLLPQMLREKLPDRRIGFFLHIPFPSYEIFRLLPQRWRAELLNGMLGADLVGFHTYDYTQYFLKCVRRIVGREHYLGEIAMGDHVARADAFPMGVDIEAFSARAERPEIRQAREELRRPLGESKVVLSIDRLDYSKGIDHRLLAYQLFLERNPTWRSRVVLILTVVPSRTGVEQYRQLKSRIDELVGQINGQYGTLTWTPILYQYKNFGCDQLTAMYSASAVMLVTPMRDGMNLVAKEYIASRTDDTGVLILSEMAGAASELGEAMLVNPNDIIGMAEALYEALEMPTEMQRRNMSAMRQRLRRYDVIHWADEFVDRLSEPQTDHDRNWLTAEARSRIIRDFQRSPQRLIICDYDGTLVPLRRERRLAEPDDRLLRLLEQLARGAEVVLISGRDRETLQEWFGDLDVVLIAEHGIGLRERQGGWRLRNQITRDWMPRVRELLELYAARLPGSWVEEKEFTLAWHYEQADLDMAWHRVAEARDHLIGLAENSPVQVLEGNKVIEVRPAGVSKGSAVQRFLNRGSDFILVLGGDRTDEDLFKALPENAYSIRVGLTRSQARFNVPQRREVMELLKALADVSAQTPTAGDADEPIEHVPGAG